MLVSSLVNRLTTRRACTSARGAPRTLNRRTLFGWGKPKPEEGPKSKSTETGHVHGPGCGHTHDHPPRSAPRPPTPTSSHPPKSTLRNVKHFVAVASGKGGVGKSTVAVNLALAMSQLQKRIGLLDADIYGPSIPTMMNLTNERPKVSQNGDLLIPLVNYGIECMSMGFLVSQNAPTIWRGPMVMSALDQMLHQVAWNDLDVLVIDLPPGTGDAQLTLVQRTPLSGAVIVSTPQEVALADVTRGANMFRKVNVPLLGLIENMAYFEPPCGCNQRYYIFGEGGAKRTAADMNIPFLGEIPIEQSIREYCDRGTPTVAAEPDSPTAQLYRSIAQRILNQLEQEKGPQGPTITIED